MIVPWLNCHFFWKKAPLAWTLIFLNFAAYILTIDARPPQTRKGFSSTEQVVLTGKLFYQYKNLDAKDMPILADSEWVILGAQGLRDPDFVKAATSAPFRGDMIAIENWRKEVDAYGQVLLQRNSRLYGLKTNDTSVLSWVTYQFMHADGVHLFFNMALLFVFATVLEQMVGGLILVLLYILGGIAGAYVFLLLGTASVAPMVGASASLSALMAFYACYESKRRVSFLYLVSPFQGYYGLIYLPTLIIFPLCFLPDLVGYLSTPEELGSGIAYTAHLGGAAFGLATGLLARHFRKAPWLHRLFSYAR